MQVINLTPFSYLQFSKSDNKGLEFGVLAVKATYAFDETDACALSDEQESLNAEEQTFGRPDNSSLKRPTDLVGYKPSTDVIVNAIAYAPEGEPAKAWNIGLEITDAAGTKIQKTLRITGPRWWVPKWKRALSDEEQKNWKDHRDLFEGWELSEPEPIVSLPVRYEYAYGGSVAKGSDEHGNAVLQSYEYNPVGRGFIDIEWTDHTKPVAAPQIEYADEPVTDPYKHYKPAGYGAIQRAWLPRRPLGGTFNQHWVDHVWPKWPADYDFAFNNAAAEGLCGHGFLKLPIRVQLVNLHPTKRNCFLNFKELNVHAAYQTTHGTVFGCEPHIDTLHIELSDTDSFAHYASVVWRTVYNRDETEAIALGLADTATDDVEMKMLHPADCGTYSEALERPDV